MSKSGNDRPMGLSISAAPAATVRKSIAHLHRSAVAREKRLNLLLHEQARVRQELNAPIVKLLQSNRNDEVSMAALNRFETVVMNGSDAPAVPTDIDSEVQWGFIGSERVGVVGAPFPHNFTQPDTSNRPDGNVSDADGNVIISANPSSDGMTAIGGIGFEFVPTPDLTMVFVRSSLSFNYAWSTVGTWPLNAHSEGKLGLLVHRLDPNGSIAEEFDFPSTLWDVTSDGASDHQQGSTTLVNYLPTLISGSRYIMWSYARVYCNSTDAFLGSSRGIAWLRMKCNLMTIASIFIP